MSLGSILAVLALTTLGDWLTTLTLIFGGCCSNALSLEILTAQRKDIGTLITFVQFLFVAIVGIRKQIVVLPSSFNISKLHQRIASLGWKTAKDGDRMRLHLTYRGQADKPAVLEGILGSGKNAFQRTLSCDVIVYPSDSVFLHRSLQSALRQHLKDVKESHIQGVHRVTLPDDLLLIYLAKRPASSHADHNGTEESNQSKDAILSSKNLAQVIDISVPSRPTVLWPVSSTWLAPWRLRFKARKIPFKRYAIQVSLFLLVSLLNNAAFAYQIPMPVHIIFRSGGLVVNMLLGWLMDGRRYSRFQVLSIILVTMGVCLTTLSAQLARNRGPPRSMAFTASSASEYTEPFSLSTYLKGISILTLALVFAGMLGIMQDKTFQMYGRDTWKEAMFYLHAMALPMFAFKTSDLVAQFDAVNSSPAMALNAQTMSTFLAGSQLAPTLDGVPSIPLPYIPISMPTFRIPSIYIPLFLNVFTQLVCVSGVNRLTSRVNSLTVTLVLVVRKAVSVGISVLLLGNSKGNQYLWIGAGLVLLGTITYSIGGSARRKADKAE